MIETLTKEDWDNLADILWFVKGYLSCAKDLDMETCPFMPAHTESLRKARVLIRELLEE